MSFGELKILMTRSEVILIFPFGLFFACFVSETMNIEHYVVNKNAGQIRSTIVEVELKISLKIT